MNNEMKFDPQTGKPITNTNEIKEDSQKETIEEPQKETEKKQNKEENSQNVQSIATVDQSNEKFLNNAQTNTNEKQNKMDEKSSYWFMFILFAIIFVTIVFIFPLIKK